MTVRGFSLSIPQVSPKGFVVIDTETTGSKDDSRVIELGMVFISPRGRLQKTFTTLLHGGGTSGEWYVKRVHRIRDMDLIGAPKFRQIAPDFLKSINGRILFAHNAIFDLKRINHELLLVRRRQIKNMACTIELGKHLGYGRLSLENAIEEFNLYREISHHALHDAMATSQLLQHYLSEDQKGVREYLSLKGFHI
jgi:DNA polymerase-3 subunit epsilon